MEDVLEVYTRPYDERYPQVGVDEMSRQLISETRVPLPMQPGQPACYDYEYERQGTCNLFVACELLAGKRYLKATEHRTKADFALFIRDLVDVYYPSAEKIILVMDNLNTHTPAAFYEAFAPPEARRLVEKLEIHYTPKHGSWFASIGGLRPLMHVSSYGVCILAWRKSHPSNHDGQNTRGCTKRPGERAEEVKSDCGKYGIIRVIE